MPSRYAATSRLMRGTSFDPKTRAFAAYNRDGTTRTFFKPNSRDYFDRQPGRPVKLQDLKFK